MAKAEPVGGATVLRTRALRFNWGLVIMILLIGSMGFYILYPLALILINSFNVATIADPPAYGLGAWRDAFTGESVTLGALVPLDLKAWRYRVLYR